MPSNELMQQLAATVQLCGANWGPEMLPIVLSDLAHYSEPAVIAALAQCRRECKYKLALADIIERIEAANPDGWPGPNEAWAAVGTLDERVTMVCVDEAFQALEAARALLATDEIGARMAFIEAYRRLVARARLEGRRPVVRSSLGTDGAQRERVLGEAVARGLLPAEAAERQLGRLPAGIPSQNLPALPPSRIEQNVRDLESIKGALAAGNQGELRKLLDGFEARDRAERAEAAKASAARLEVRGGRLIGAGERQAAELAQLEERIGS